LPAQCVPISYLLAASTDYIKRNGVPKSPDDLARHDFVAVGNVTSLEFIGPNGNIDVPIRVALRYRSALGVANRRSERHRPRTPAAILFEDPMFKTRLSPVLMEYPLRKCMLYLVYVSRKYLPLKIVTFRDFLIERISQTPEPRPLALVVHQ